MRSRRWAASPVALETSWFNHASRTAIARLGAKQDGITAQPRRHADGSVRDTVVFSIIDSEWPAVKHEPAWRGLARMSARTIGIVGARGHVGAELIRLIAAHPRFELAFVSSRERGRPARGRPCRPALRGELRYSAPAPSAARRSARMRVVLALPNGKARACVAAFDATGASDPVIVDLSADYRFDDDWYYGLPELTRDRSRGQRRISNPGCYATAMQLAIAPMRDVLAGPVQCFGVSGYSGAGTTPSDKNDPDKLRDNLMPYALAGHVHEREVSAQLRPSGRIHAARGAAFPRPDDHGEPAPARARSTRDEVLARYRDAYARRTAGARARRGAVGQPRRRPAPRRDRRIHVGRGRQAPGRRVDASTTCSRARRRRRMQNLNLAFGFDEFAGIPHRPRIA